MLFKPRYNALCKFDFDSILNNCKKLSYSNNSKINLNPPLEKHFPFFQSLLSPAGLIHNNGQDDLLSYNVDWLRKYKGSSKLVLLPSSTLQVSKILSYCYKHSLKLCVQGGNTSLVGGSVPVGNEIILSLRKLDRIIKFSQSDNFIVCEAGCILQNLNDYLSKHDQIMPLDLGAKGSCFIGGNVATNAGGLRFMRYGSLKQNVLGLEVALANEEGQVLDLMKTLKKDNTGIDLKQLFIGSEGTLGVITKVAIATVPKPKAINVALFGLANFENVKRLFVKSRLLLGEILSAVEFFDHDCVKLVQQAFKIDRFALDRDYPFYILVETHGSNTEHDQHKLEVLVEYLLNNSIVEDGTLAFDSKQMDTIWKFRENIPDAASNLGKVYKCDVSLPLNSYYECVENMRAHLLKIKDELVSVCGYGHIGDQNLHLNIITKQYSNETQNLIEPHIFEFIKQNNGSISAEHGLGIQKAKYIEYTKPRLAVEYMRQIKKVFNPNDVLNPGKMIL